METGAPKGGVPAARRTSGGWVERRRLRVQFQVTLVEGTQVVRTYPGVDNALYSRAQIAAVYQPIVDMVHRDVVAVEALARWPQLPVTPDIAFDLARSEGRVGELGPRLVAEITERALLDNPAGLLRSIRQMRDRGCGIALDDVGAVPESLALLAFVAPDVIKLDISLIQAWPDADQARIVTAVAAYAERSRAMVLAEGIETEAHYHQALALGATLGQGWYFSRPGPLVSYPPLRQPIELVSTPAPTGETPFELLDPHQLRIGSKGLLLSISRHIEQQGQTLQTPPLVLSAFQDSTRFTADTARRYRSLAIRCPRRAGDSWIANPPTHPIGAVLFHENLGADDGIRTRDPNLGKVVLYQLSHVRSGRPS